MKLTSDSSSIVSSIVFVYPNSLFALIYICIYAMPGRTLSPWNQSIALSRLVLGWLRQVVMHLSKCHQPLLMMYSFSILNKELTLSMQVESANRFVW